MNMEGYAAIEGISLRPVGVGPTGAEYRTPDTYRRDKAPPTRPSYAETFSLSSEEAVPSSNAEAQQATSKPPVTRADVIGVLASDKLKTREMILADLKLSTGDQKLLRGVSQVLVDLTRQGKITSELTHIWGHGKQLKGWKLNTQDSDAVDICSIMRPLKEMEEFAVAQRTAALEAETNDALAKIDTLLAGTPKVVLHDPYAKANLLRELSKRLPEPINITLAEIAYWIEQVYQIPKA